MDRLGDKYIDVMDRLGDKYIEVMDRLGNKYINVSSINPYPYDPMQCRLC